MLSLLIFRENDCAFYGQKAAVAFPPLFPLKTQDVNVVQNLHSAICEGHPVLHTVSMCVCVRIALDEFNVCSC